MELTQIISLLSSAIIGLCGLVFAESIKEVIKKYFALKTKKEVKKYYRVILLIAVLIPITIAFLDSQSKPKATIFDKSIKVEPINPN